VSAQKPTASAAKLRTWEQTRALDRRALKLLAAGATLEQAYRQAMSELVPNPEQNPRAACDSGLFDRE
jgi:hypothetical protein